MRSPDGQKAHGFFLATCDRPGCGPHIIGFDHNEVPFCDIAIPMNGLPKLIKALQNLAYAKAVEREDEG
jgi:hypothetical protein